MGVHVCACVSVLHICVCAHVCMSLSACGVCVHVCEPLHACALEFICGCTCVHAYRCACASVSASLQEGDTLVLACMVQMISTGQRKGTGMVDFAHEFTLYSFIRTLLGCLQCTKHDADPTL